jgi:hypothetical protein
MKSPLHSNTHLYRRATMYQEDLTVEIFRERPTSSNRLNNNNSSSNNRGLSAVRERWHRGIHRTRRTLSPHRRPRTLPPLPKISTWGYSALTACPLPQPSCQVAWDPPGHTAGNTTHIPIPQFLPTLTNTPWCTNKTPPSTVMIRRVYS